MSTTSTQPTDNAGFTLIEVLVVSPLVILIVGVLVAAIISLTGKSLVAQQTSSALSGMQVTFDDIDRDMTSSGKLSSTTGSLSSPQGSNDATSAFNASDKVLIVQIPALDKDNLNDVRNLIHYSDAPNSCSSDGVNANSIVYITHVYFVKDEYLWRRTILPGDIGNACKTPWQVDTCAPGQTASRCKSQDKQLVRIGDGSFDLTYLKKDGSAIPVSSAGSAYAVEVSIASKLQIAGRTTEVNNSTKLLVR